MNLEALFSSARILKQLSPAQALGFIIEFCPSHQLLELGRYSTHTELKTLIKTNLSKLKNNLDKIDEHTLVLLEMTGAEFASHRERLDQIGCWNIGVIVSRSFHLQYFGLPPFRGFYHFPIAESYNEVYWSMDEIFLYLLTLKSLPHGPQAYDIFDPSWKYTQSPYPTGESNFHTNLHPDLFKQAYRETKKDSEFRAFLLSASKLQVLPLAILFFISKELPTAAQRFVLNFKRLLRFLWLRYIKYFYNKLASFLKFLERLWCKYIFWPIEYHIRTWGKNMTNDEYEAMKTAENSHKARAKQEALLRKR